MRLQVKGKNVEVTPSIRAYAERSSAKLEKQLAEPTQVEVELSEENNPSIAASHVAEGTIFTKGPTLRAREASPDMRASIDQLVEKLERQVKRYREKRDRGAAAACASPRRVGRRAARIAAVRSRHPREAAVPFGDDPVPRGPWDIAGIHGLQRAPSLGCGRRRGCVRRSKAAARCSSPFRQAGSSLEEGPALARSARPARRRASCAARTAPRRSAASAALWAVAANAIEVVELPGSPATRSS